eukprot:m.77565 g.77565  ORF g.77565 m.77565 type:complete len:416 (+) comp14706_c0_seq1:33-1280(+)
MARVSAQMLPALAAAAAVLLLLLNPATALPFRQYGEVQLEHPSFFSVVQPEGDEFPSLLVSEFGPLSSGKVLQLTNLNLRSADAVNASVISSAFLWPNMISMAPAGALPVETLVVPDGFLVPGYSTGGIWLVPTPFNGSAVAIEISTSLSGYFYHQVEWYDVDGDGLLDIVTARVDKPIFGSSKGQLVWLRQPSSDPFNNAWTEQVLADGPEVFFTLTSAFDANTVQVFASQFFTNKLGLYVFDKRTFQLKFSRLLETDAPYDDSKIVDLNADGRLELIVTTHEGKQGGGIYAYEIPSDLQHGKFVKHALAEGFPVTEGGFQQAAPGFAYPVFPRWPAPRGARPSLLVAGDGSQSAYFMEPVGPNFQYNITTIIKVDGVIGAIGIGQFNDDNFTDFFIPNYDKGQLYLYTFAPEE